MKISIILPVLNEASNLTTVLDSLQKWRRAGHELVVVDGGSQDNSLQLATELADVTIISQPGRGLQMNNGAAASSGEIFLFLHADSFLLDNALEQIEKARAQNNRPCSFWGRFDVELSGQHFLFRVIERAMNLRSRLTSIATGDQAIFIEKDLFLQVKGFPEIALMEDVALSKRLKKQARPVCLKSTVVTSSRRWEQRGIVKTILLMWKLRLYYFAGVSPEALRGMYR